MLRVTFQSKHNFASWYFRSTKTQNLYLMKELASETLSKRWITSCYVLCRAGRTVPSFRCTQCTCNGLTYPKPCLNHAEAFLLIICPQPIIMLKQEAGSLIWSRLFAHLLYLHHISCNDRSMKSVHSSTWCDDSGNASFAVNGQRPVSSLFSTVESG